MKKRIIITGIGCVMLGVVYYFLFGAMFESIMDGAELHTDEYKKTNTVRVTVFKEIHRMANTKIIAEDGEIWGEIDITAERIERLIKEVETSAGFDDATRRRLLEILYRWQSKDFSEIVEDHNYVWRKLGGTVGKAIRAK